MVKCQYCDNEAEDPWRVCSHENCINRELVFSKRELENAKDRTWNHLKKLGEMISNNTKRIKRVGKQVRDLQYQVNKLSK